MTSERVRLDVSMIGWPVSTPWGEDLGDVKEVRGQYFKLDVPEHADLWLRADCVGSAADGRVVLNIARDGLDACIVDEPDETA